MNHYKGYYGIIQYCPDFSRAEAANVGVILFCPELGYIEAKASRGNDRVAKFFGRSSFDLDRLNTAKTAIKERLYTTRSEFRTLEDFERFAVSRGNELQITAPRPLKLVNPEEELETLFNELVGGRATKDEKQVTYLHKQFMKMGDRIEFKKTVSVPTLNNEFEVDYAYRNGTMNLVKTQTFSRQKGHAFNKAMQLAVTGHLLHKHPDEDGTRRILTIVSLNNSKRKTGEAEQNIRKLLKEYDTHYVPYSSINSFLTKVAKEAH